MTSIFRSIAAVIAGFVVASIIMTAVEALNGRVFYPEIAKAAEGVTDRETVRALLASAPAGALLVVIAGWILGSLAGGWTTARIAAHARLRHALVLGALLTLAGIANNLMIPPPLWFWVVGLIVMIPAAYMGGRLGEPPVMYDSRTALT